MGKYERQMSVINEYNEKLKSAGLTISASDDAMISSCGLWLMNSQNEIGENVLFLDPGDGYLAALAAYLNSGKWFEVVLSTAEADVKAADIIKKLELENIKVSDDGFNSIEGKKYNTVISGNSFAEYVGIDKNRLRYRPFNEQFKGFSSAYDDYIYFICNSLEDGGNCLAIETILMGTEFYGILDAFNSYGMKFDADKVSTMELVGDKTGEQMILVAFALTKEKESTEDMFVKWAKLALGSDKQMTEARADYILFTTGGKLLEGYSAYDKTGKQVALCGVYAVKDDDNSFLMYQASETSKTVKRFPFARKLDMLNTLSRDKEIAKKAGFIVMDFNVSKNK